MGLPVALEFAKHGPVVGLDIDPARVTELHNGIDKTGDVSTEELALANGLKFTSNSLDIKDSNIFIVTVPTPIDKFNAPDLTDLIKVSEMLGSFLKTNDLVIYESTVFPGATEEVCVPILESASGLKFNRDFFVGYSPERVNPGDKINTITKIVKVTSGSTPEIATFVDELYSSIISAGTFKATSIRVAEAAKIIENTQRDVNIALINEFSRVCHALSIDTHEVLAAAATKWNFVDLEPGFVGGHCISIDPYYLLHKAQHSGYFPNLINTARMLNESMPHLVSQDYFLLMGARKPISKSTCLVVGVTFKANCPDLRNSKVSVLLDLMENAGIEVDVFDPVAGIEQCRIELNRNVFGKVPDKVYDGLMFCVEHDLVREMGEEYWLKYLNKGGIIFDLKAIFSKDFSDYRL